jgi:uncharacterized protein YbgA (DUF1722 family)/uncharacterized protein YbbK (DUF523 family)
MDQNSKPIKIGISQCLLGSEVRYDGQHKLDKHLINTYGPFFEWQPFCPEFESGMGIPREAMRLEGDFENPKLMTRNSRTDKTKQLLDWSIPKSKSMSNDDLSGIIFKKGSPSCGLFKMRPYTEVGHNESGAGLFAREVIKQNPHIPMEEEGRLKDSGLREIFIGKVFVYHRWKNLNEAGLTPAKLIQFHQDHKYQLMSHSPDKLKALGQLVAKVNKGNIEVMAEDYFILLCKTISLKPTIAKHSNTLSHIFGYFKKELSSDEKAEMLELFENYRNKISPLIVPVTMLKHYIRKYKQPYLSSQTYLDPHPKELMIRNSS